MDNFPNTYLIYILGLDWTRKILFVICYKDIYFEPEKKKEVNCDSGTNIHGDRSSFYKGIGLKGTSDIVALVGCQMVELNLRL